MKSVLTIQSFLWFAVYFVSGVVLLTLFTKLYLLVTPYNEQDQIMSGKKAPAISLVGAMIGFTIPIVSMSYHGAQFFEFLVWSILSGIVQLGWFKLMYHFLPKQIEVDNSAVAIFYAGAAVCVGLINAFSLIP